MVLIAYMNMKYCIKSKYIIASIDALSYRHVFFVEITLSILYGANIIADLNYVA